ncbi:WXG100 family type VII secretion target [Actinoallomurus purpureus]|uniref:WXG100 family type VII secretion target n=1 Tax=Actinoallomurus purpureus TaxID=478114 RepID=UPI002093AFA9|nr:WXG100 family type VII secretion target [Actinoallomurus purpureus]MCO6011606.1 WXG100 family type VII secretion target [Actinoallomurus purpureus]
MSSEFTQVNFTALNTGEEDFVAVHNAVVGLLEELDRQLQSNLADWTGDARTQYHTAKAQWTAAANHMTAAMNQLAKVIGTAHENYTAVEKANAQMW